MKARKLTAMLLTLAMALSLLTVGAVAANPTSLTGYGESVGSISITGADVVEANLTTSTNGNGTIYDYYITLDGDTADGTTVTATFSKQDPSDPNCEIATTNNIPNPPLGIVVVHANASLTYNVTLSEGAGTVNAYVYHDLVNAFASYDTYRFHYALEYPVSISTGDPVFIAWDGNSGTVTGRNGSGIIPASFTLWAEGISSITVDGVTRQPSYSDSTGGRTNYAYEIETTSAAQTIVAGAYTISCGARTVTPVGGTPSAIVSYLPIGQYATGQANMWGDIDNLNGRKLVNGFASTGVSLGALGGYIEFRFDGGITNDPRNPYGVDFVIYGNAFNGNPEAGAVQVSEDGKTWYELAGSRYYDGNFSWNGNQGASGKLSNAYSGTLRNTSVQYTLVEGESSSEIQASLGGIGAVTLVEGDGWWPAAGEGYPMAGSHVNENANVQ